MIRSLPLLPILLAASFAAAESRSYRGVAVELETGKPLYSELHQEEGAGGKANLLKTTFVNAGGDTIAERTLDFKVSSTKPAYAYRDRRSGWEEGAREEGEAFRVYCRKGKGKARREKILHVPGPAVIDGGFNNFLRQNMADLDAGKKLQFNFVVPSRLDWYRFVAREDREASKDGLKVLVAEPENALLRLVAPRIQVTYDPKTGLMAGYQGISNLSDDKGGNQYIRLTYPEGGP
jgi:hypothetical protein